MKTLEMIAVCATALMVTGAFAADGESREDGGNPLPGQTNKAVRVVADRPKVQLWKGGPYWATMNIGARSPHEYGYYFWWGDTVGYKRENDAWVASDGSAADFSFASDNAPTYNKRIWTLQCGGWITEERLLASGHDAAQVHWGGGWRMPTSTELKDLESKCSWTWTTVNGVNGYVVRGQGDYSAASIFLPAAGLGNGTLLDDVGSDGRYWSATVCPDNYYYLASYLVLYPDGHYVYEFSRYFGQSVRPVQGPAE